MIRTIALFALFVCFVASASGIAQSGKVDVSGTWNFEVTTDAGTGSPTVTLKQDGEKLTGHYSSATLGEADLTGTVTGDQIEFSFNVDVQGTQLPVSYKGTVESGTSMKGTVSLGGLAQGTFTAKKK